MVEFTADEVTILKEMAHCWVSEGYIVGNDGPDVATTLLKLGITDHWCYGEEIQAAISSLTPTPST